METVKVDILNPKARKLLKDLADLDLIAIRKSDKSDFSKILKKLRSKSEYVPTPEEIAKEVEVVRSERNNK
ncbi:hypothetical protein [Rhodohalobacter sulfatireducens]|uniref:Antitoxin n=1 Tax=Rhodohalobacter sulfatireducens TaxID=2911366 RepID=A0ABS9KG81_9BACT|nr:hypothetical protein [Rhodohalobacter sulfatireducens]MCG2589848.1 hypothetical protein [Rhodohalobacter sulfatireducens]MDR9366140.1 hypothetical protein [Balneolaceae bacterium]MDR9408202.1 hypothetical protein [Balneolaceae bacterium]